MSFDIPWQPGVFPNTSVFADRLPAVGISAIGQDQVASTPCRWRSPSRRSRTTASRCAPASSGEIGDQDGRVVRSFGPEEWAARCRPEMPRKLTQMIINVVEHRTGTAVHIPGTTLGGKTGTAQPEIGNEPLHAWFGCLSPDLDLVAVVVLSGGNLGSEATGGHVAATGGHVAAPIARAVLEATIR